MGMSAWGIFAAPILAHAPVPADTAAMLEIETVQMADQGSDLFSGFAPMDELSMSEASGGADTAIDIGNMGVNLADNDGSVDNVNVNNSETGDIANNTVAGNDGITTVFNNTGNGVIFQSNVNVNIFLNEGVGN